MRYHVYTEARHPTGAVASGHSLHIYDDAAGTVTSSIYAAASGGSPLANPLTVPATGKVDFWVTVPNPYGDSGDGVLQPLPILVATPRDIGLGVYSAAEYGIAGDGETDDTDAWNELFVRVAAAGGGAIHLPAPMHSVCLGALAPMPYVSAFASTSPFLRIFGTGGFVGAAGMGPQGASVLDLRYDGLDGLHPAKLDARGYGLLEIDHLTIASGGADDWPLIQTTNTALSIHNNYISGNQAHSANNAAQDALVLGGSTTNEDGTATAAFQGYGTVIRDNSFDCIRRCVYGGVYSEAIVEGNIVGQTCGGDATHAAVEFNAWSGANTRGNVINNNRFACMNYVYSIRFVGSGCRNNVGIGNRFWDYGAGFLGMVSESEGAECNPMLGSIDESYSGTLASAVSMGLAKNAATGPWIFGGPTLHDDWPLLAVQPRGFSPTANAVMIQTTRSDVEAVDPNVPTLSIDYSGNVVVEGTIIMRGGKWFGLDDGVGFVGRGGNLVAYATGENNAITPGRGLFGDRSFATTGRPAATIGAGATYYDTTLSKPVFSDGTKWRDAAGTEV